MLANVHGWEGMGGRGNRKKVVRYKHADIMGTLRLDPAMWD